MFDNLRDMLSYYSFAYESEIFYVDEYGFLLKEDDD